MVQDTNVRQVKCLNFWVPCTPISPCVTGGGRSRRGRGGGGGGSAKKTQIKIVPNSLKMEKRKNGKTEKRKNATTKKRKNEKTEKRKNGKTDNVMHGTISTDPVLVIFRFSNLERLQATRASF